MKKLTSSCLVVLMIFSLIFGSNPISTKAAEIKNENNLEEKTEDQREVEIKAEDQNEEKTNANIGADYNVLHADEVSEDSFKYNTSLFSLAESKNKLINSQVNMIVMLIDFPESENDPDKGKVTINSTYTTSQIEVLNSAFVGKSKSLQNYISTVSGGKCSVNPVLTYKNEDNVYVYTADHPLGYYLPYSTSNPTGYKDSYYDRTQLFTSAFASLKKYIPSNLDLDVDDDGYIDSIDFFTSYCGSWNDFLWSHSWQVMNQTEMANGATLRYYNQITYPNYNAYIYETITHEYMHTIGYPDMYVYEEGEYPNPFDSWTIMTYGTSGYPTVWERIKYGEWIEEDNIDVISNEGDYLISNSTLDSKNNKIGYKIEIPNSNQFFMVEYRDKNASVYESEFKGSGLIVYRVNPNKNGNASGAPELYLLRNENQSCDYAYLDGSSGHESLDLVTSNGESVGTITYKGKVNGQAKFNFDKKRYIVNINTNPNSGCVIGKTVSIDGIVYGADESTNYLYTVEDSLGNVTTIGNSTESSIKWTPKKAGNYTITLTITDEEGTTLRKSINYRIYNPITLNSYSFDKQSPQSVGTAIKLSVDAVGGTGNIKCLSMYAMGGNYPYGSKTIYFNIQDSKTGVWTPEVAGEYSIFATVQDETGYTNLLKIGTYIVEENETTIYYKGYDNPYIHYKVGNGAWTDAPGVEMEATTDLEGYSHKITISLGQAENLTACFNNGNGSWDSNNGNNYSFQSGYYTYSNGAISKIDKPTKKLNISSITTNYPKGITGLGTVTINTTVENAQGNVTYTFTDIAEDGTATVIKSNTTSSSTMWNPSMYGNHTIKVTATDEKTTSTKTINFVANEYVKSKIEGSTNVKVGKTSKYVINATGGTGKLNYRYYYTKWPSTQEVELQSSSNNTLVWTPKDTGTYQLWYEISDEGGYKSNRGYISVFVEENNEEENETVIYYKGYDNPYIHYKVGNGAWTDAPGVKMEATTDLEGYSHKITISLGQAENLTVCFNNGNGSWDSNNGNNYSFKSGYYTYNNGVITAIEKPSKELKINSITSSSGSTIKMGSTVNITINASGGEGKYKYSLYYNAYGSGRIVNLLNESSSNTVLYEPDYPKKTTLYATVVDEAGNEVKYTQTFDVKEIEANEITIYYKGYDNAYIHYKIGNGLWTNAPGVLMEKTSEMIGYTHKIVIDLGESENLTACFNNGNGSWDSNGGNNYMFNGIGAYTYSSGNIIKIN